MVQLVVRIVPKKARVETGAGPEVEIKNVVYILISLPENKVFLVNRKIAQVKHRVRLTTKRIGFCFVFS